MTKRMTLTTTGSRQLGKDAKKMLERSIRSIMNTLGVPSGKSMMLVIPPEDDNLDATHIVLTARIRDDVDGK